MATLVRDAELRKKMGRAARQYIEKRSFENAFLKLWKLKDHDRHLYLKAAGMS
jgi:hypothetical protein